MNNNDTGMNGVNNGLNNGMNPNSGMGQMSPNGFNQTMGGDNLQGMSLGSVATPEPSNPSMMNPEPNEMNSFANPGNVGQSTNPNMMNPTMNGMQEGGNVSPQVDSFNQFSNPIPASDSINGMNPNPLQNNNIDSLGTIDNGMASPMNTSNDTALNNTFQPSPSLDTSNLVNQEPMNQGITMDPNLMMDHSMNMNQPMNAGMNNFGVNPMNNTGNMGNGMNSNMNMDPNLMNPQNPNIPNNNIFETVPTPPNMMDFNQNGGKKPKKGMSKTTLIIILILVIAIIGGGVYYVLTMTKKPKGNITVNDLKWDLGKELSTNISDYATITGFDSTVCSLDVSKVDINKMGAYDFSVTCGTTSKSGKIILQDSTAPVVVTKKVSVVPGTTVQIEDFIVSCTDNSNCSYEFEDKDIALDSLTSQEGTHQLNIVVSDDYNNQTTVEVVLEVTNNAPVKFMFCTPTSNLDNELNATVETTYNYGINGDNHLVQTQKVTTYTFEVREDYEKGKERITNEYPDAVISTDDSEFVITITSDLEENDLSTEFNVNPFPTDYDDLKEFNLNQGISCKNR